MRERRAARRSERRTRACARRSQLHGSGSSPERADPDLLELFGDGVDAKGALRCPRQPAAHLLPLAHLHLQGGPLRAHLRVLACCPGRVQLRPFLST